MKTLSIMLFIGLSFSITAQNFKKDILPIINAKDYSEQAKNTCVKFHNQNTNADGTLTSKAILMQYENVLKVRQHLGLCYYALGLEGVKPQLLDSAIYYLNEAQSMDGASDLTKLINTIKEKKSSLIAQQKNKLLEEEKQKKQEEHNRLYGEKTAVVTFVGGEFLGYCNVYFKTTEGEELRFMNPNFGRFANSDDCRLKEMYINETFKIVYKLGQIKVYSEDAGEDELVDTDVVVNIQLADYERAEQLRSQELLECKKELNIRVQEFKTYRNQSPEFVDKIVERANSVGTVDECFRLTNEITQELQRQNELKVLIEETGKQQVQFKAKDACPSCLITTAKKFLQACIDVNGTTIQANLCACALNGDKTSCTNIGRIRPFPYSRYMQKPDVNVAKGFLEKQDRFVVYYFSETIAGVVIKPYSSHEARVIYMVKEAGKWKVIGIDDSRDRAMIAYLNSK